MKPKQMRWRVTRWKLPGSRADGLYFCRETSRTGEDMVTCRQTHLTRVLAQAHADELNRAEEAKP